VLRLFAVPVALVAASLAVAACGGGDGGGSAELPPGVVAQVGDKQITQTELDRLLAQQEAQAKSQGQTFPAAGSEQYQSLRRAALQQLVEQEIVGMEAAKCGKPCNVTSKDVTAEIVRIKKQNFQNSETKFQEFLKQQKLSIADARRILRTQLEEPKLFAQVTKGIRFTAADAKRYYDANPAQFKVAAQRTARHILVKTKAEADRIRARVTDSNFAALAKRYSTDMGTKNSGGDLGQIQRGQLVPQFEKVAFSLGNGEISKPVKTQFGWHIIEVKVTPARTQSFAEAKAGIIQSQLQQRRQQKATQWRDQVLASYRKRTRYADSALVPTTAATTAPVPQGGASTSPTPTAP
jgi:foldase protein PrsA